MFYSDQQIQDYLDGAMTPEQEEQFELELNKNRQLCENLDVYRQLYAKLEDEHDIQLSPDFTASVLKKNDLTALGSLHFNLWHIFIGLFVVIVAINVSFIYVDTEQLVTDVIASPQITPTQDTTPLLQSIMDQINSININTPIPVLAVIILLVLFLIDRWFLKHQKKMNYGGRSL